MQNEGQSLHAAQSNAEGQASDQHSSQIAQLSESVELARSDLRRTRHDMKQQMEEHGAHVRRTRVLWVIAILLVGGVGALMWNSYEMSSGYKSAMAGMPGLGAALDNARSRIASAESTIGSWADENVRVKEHLSRIENAVGTLRSEARTMAQQIKADVGRTIVSLQDRIAGVESIQRENGAEVARLQNELAGLRQELVNLREDNLRQIHRVEQAAQQEQQATRSGLSDLNRKLTTNQTAVSALANQVDRERIDFELQNGRTQEVAPGIYLTVRRTNVQHQRMDGWLQIAKDGRILWLRDEAAQQQIDFSSQSDQRAYRLMFTKIGKTGATGYVLVPVAESTQSAPSAN
jgi:hypothetical protein